jgi:molybdopterin synthase sulfur carrier subunit
MKINVIAFGIARDILGGSTQSIEVTDNCSVGELRTQLMTDYPALERLVSLAIAVNTEYALDNQPISERDEIVLIPPVSGG